MRYKYKYCETNYFLVKMYRKADVSRLSVQFLRVIFTGKRTTGK